MHLSFATMKQAMQMNCYLSVGGGRYRIFWPQGGIELFAATAEEAIADMKEAQEMGLKSTVKDDASHIGGVSTNGAIAYKDGVPASDCPYMEEDPDFARWNSEWDEAADQETEAEKSKPKVGSVITNRYRALYSENGHPTHCGDALAILLNGICSNRAGTNIELFEAICAANGIDLSKYSRTSKGWQGRLRMTGRNLLARKVRENGGKLMLPEGLGPEFYQLSADWIEEAEQKYKPKRS